MSPLPGRPKEGSLPPGGTARNDTTELTLNVSVNGQAHTLHAFSTLADLIGQLGHAPESIATALNGAFVARSQRHERVLRDGDQVACFQAIVGG